MGLTVAVHGLNGNKYERIYEKHQRFTEYFMWDRAGPTQEEIKEEAAVDREQNLGGEGY